MIEGLAALPRRFDRDPKLLAQGLLSHELFEPLRAKALVEIAIGAEWLGIGDPLVLGGRRCLRGRAFRAWFVPGRARHRYRTPC